MIQNYENLVIPATVGITTAIVVGAAFGGYIYYQNNQTNAVIVKLQEEIDALKFAEVNLPDVMGDPALEHKVMHLISLNKSLITRVTELTLLHNEKVNKISLLEIDTVFELFKQNITTEGFVCINQNIPLLQKKFKAIDLHNYLLSKSTDGELAQNVNTPIDISNLQPHLEKIVDNRPIKILADAFDKVKEKIKISIEQEEPIYNFTTESNAFSSEDLQSYIGEHIVTLLSSCDKTFFKIMTTFSTWATEGAKYTVMQVDSTLLELLNLVNNDGIAVCGVAGICLLSQNDTIIDLPNISTFEAAKFAALDNNNYLLRVNNSVFTALDLLTVEMQLFNIKILKYGATFLAQNPHIMDYLKTHPDDLVTLQQLFFISKTSVFSNCLPDVDLIAKYLVKSNLKNTIPWIKFSNDFIRDWSKMAWETQAIK